MPASRSRGTQWQRTLRQLCERDGAIELALAPSPNSDEPQRGDLVWRVRLLRVDDDAIVVEAPRALGREVALPPRTELVAAIVIGQNRWVFRTVVVTSITPQFSERGGSLTLEAPEMVERCQRRHGRYDARGLHLPIVDLWPLLDPSSVAPIMCVAEGLVRDALDGRPVDARSLESVQPTVGPRFGATLMNIGGGGIGVRVEPADAPVLNRHHVLWARLPLDPIMAVPVLATAKVVHTHLDSAQLTYAGLAFDFSYHPASQRTVTEQILFTIAAQQRRRPLRAA